LLSKKITCPGFDQSNDSTWPTVFAAKEKPLSRERRASAALEL